MNLLLDTHIAIWALDDAPQLSEKARELILDPNNTIYYSTVSVWEVMLKHARRPDEIPFDEKDFSEGCRSAGFIPLGLADKHILAVSTLSRPDNVKEHNDPFDRLLIAQAKVENLSFLTHDELIPDYNERCVIPV
ncbi:MAG: type II toxin-antitoxin system VapC family toxin [Lachnospiraceae bacterium]|nr:type II toxin-antitoxin system VapC family toxin [Lachnospiraceae bacterium]